MMKRKKEFRSPPNPKCSPDSPLMLNQPVDGIAVGVQESVLSGLCVDRERDRCRQKFLHREFSRGERLQLPPVRVANGANELQ